MYKLIRNIIIGFVCHILFHIKYNNLEILDKYDKYIICPNHSRIFDPIFLYPKIENMYSVAKSELFRNKFVANFLTYHKAIPIEREKKDIKGTKQILKLLKEHNNIRLLIFPEGGIYEDNYKYNKRNTKTGAICISNLTKLPIIPVHITQGPCYFSKVTVTFGNAFIPDIKALKNKELLNKEASKLINIIYNL